MQTVFHITTRHAWEQAQELGYYDHESLQAEGFIHCSYLDQVILTANRFFNGQRGLVLLQIDGDRTHHPLQADTLPNEGTFPHLYGILNLDAVVQVFPFEPDGTGEFMILPELEREC
ncbi:DUF952 domain-containing protein [Spirulina sp. CCNP1310]|uniref:DUF952 domain-containing protein n=1 Tax=Spirulina sp. CCNP1310 TaxID=3110249 RepID=UPI002B1FEB4A|nr:DUF952 domain-containing protein [Spirulina sp. CCNP1310]MEA5417612.1 DUF952 domain-containing protein [Spirulina sp. CCNP1310]